MSDRNIITPADATRIDKADERALLAARAVIKVLARSFLTFRPTLIGAIEALDDFERSMRNEGTNGAVWRQIRAEMDYLRETEENTEE